MLPGCFHEHLPVQRCTTHPASVLALERSNMMCTLQRTTDGSRTRLCALAVQLAAALPGRGGPQHRRQGSFAI